MANEHGDSRPSTGGTPDGSKDAGPDGASRFGSAAHENRERTVLIDQSSATARQLGSLTSLERQVLALLSESETGAGKRKEEPRVFPTAKRRPTDTRTLDEFKIFRPTKAETPAPAVQARHGETPDEPAAPAETPEPAAPEPSAETRSTDPADLAPLVAGTGPSATEPAEPASMRPASAVDGAATDDGVSVRAAGDAPSDEVKTLKESWEPIDLGSIMKASLDPVPESEDDAAESVQDSRPEKADDAALPAGGDAPLAPANDDDRRDGEGLSAEHAAGDHASTESASEIAADGEVGAPVRETGTGGTAGDDDRPSRELEAGGSAQDDGPGPSTPQSSAARDESPAARDGKNTSEVVPLRARQTADSGRDKDTAPAAAAPTAQPVLVADNAGLVADGLGKRFKQRQVLRGVGLTVQRGEVVGLLGPNGAGKTTCFYIITGLISPDYGTISLDDQDITGLPMYRRARMGIGYLPQEPSIFRGLSVENNIRSVLESVESDRQAREAMLDDLLAEFSITHLRRTPALALSGGERRRVEIARALASQPSFILLDEPLAGIDPIALGDIRDLVAHLKDRGIGVLITDHNVRETLEIVDRAYIIYNGEVLMSGKPSDIVAHDDVRRVYLGDGFSL